MLDPIAQERDARFDEDKATVARCKSSGGRDVDGIRSLAISGPL